MKPEKAKISSLQLMFLIAGFILGSILILSLMDNVVRQDAWLVIILSFIASIPLVLSYAFLAKRFPGKNIIQINDIVFGTVLGKLVSLVYIILFLLLLSFQLRELWTFYITFIMPETPKLVFLTVFPLIGAYALKKGIETIARFSLYVVATICFFVTVTVLLLLGNMDFSHFIPVGELPLNKYIQATHVFSMYPLCETVVFLMVFPSVNSYKKIGRYTLGGVAIAVLVTLFITVQNTAVLGSSSSLFTSASYESVRLIDIGEFLSRIEIFVAFGMTITLFIKTCMFYYGTVTGVSQLLSLRSSSSMILPVGGIAVVLALIVFDTAVAHFNWGTKYSMFMHLPCQVVLPPLTLLIAWIRKLPRKAGGQTA